MMMNSKILTLLLCLVINAVLGQDAGQDAPPPDCNCDEISQAHQKCVNDWSALDQLRVTLEQQVRDVEFQANERCQGQVEQVRGEGQTQVEQVRGEGRAQLELVRSESQANLEQARNEGQSRLDEAQRQAQAELEMCQTQHRDLNAQYEEQGNTHRRLQESSQKLEGTLASIKSEKSKLEKSVSDTNTALSKAKKDKKAVQRELDATKKTLDEMIAAKGIITIDWELLNERIQEMQAKAEEAMKDGMGFVGEHLQFAKAKVMEFYKYLETEVYPQVKKTIEKDVIPFVQTSWKKAKDMWEEIYSPYRPVVNENVKTAKKEWNKFYKQNLESSVKEYQLDVHAATARKTVDEYMTLAHNHLLDGVKTGTGAALKFVKLEEGPDFAIDALEKLNANHEDIVFYIERFFGLMVVYFILKMLFGGKKKKGKKKMTKTEWKEKEAKAAAAVKAQQQKPKIKNAKNGYKNSKKHK